MNQNLLPSIIIAVVSLIVLLLFVGTREIRMLRSLPKPQRSIAGERERGTAYHERSDPLFDWSTQLAAKAVESVEPLTLAEQVKAQIAVKETPVADAEDFRRRFMIATAEQLQERRNKEAHLIGTEEGSVHDTTPDTTKSTDESEKRAPGFTTVERIEKVAAEIIVLDTFRTKDNYKSLASA